MNFYTSAQIAVATESWNFWRPLVEADFQAAAWLGNEDGEDSFISRPGDHGQAKGDFQWWPGRRKIILEQGKIDVTASHIDGLKGAYWEVTKSKVYKHVWPAFLAATSLVDAVTVLVKEFEKSEQPQRDINRRVAYASYWMNEFGQP